MRSVLGPNAGEEFNTLTNSLEPVVGKEASVVTFLKVSVVWLSCDMSTCMGSQGCMCYYVIYVIVKPPPRSVYLELSSVLLVNASRGWFSWFVA